MKMFLSLMAYMAITATTLCARLDAQTAVAPAAPPPNSPVTIAPLGIPPLPDATPPGKPHFDSMGAKVGEQLPELPLYALDGKVVSLRGVLQKRPTLIVTSSYTCPKSRSTYAKSILLPQKVDNRVAMVIVYVIEAHPKGDPSPYSGVEDVTLENQRDQILCPQPRTLDDRLKLAIRFGTRMGLIKDVPVFVDAMDNAAWRALGAGPNMGVLVDEHGIVLARQGWLDVPSMEAALKVLALAANQRDEARVARNNVHDDSSWDFPLFDAIRDGKVDEVEKRITAEPKWIHYIEMGMKGEGDQTMLHRAAEAGQDKVAALLIARGADVNAQPRGSPAPLHVAAKGGFLALAKLLIEHGADVNAKAEGFGPTPLQEALLYQHLDVAALLSARRATSNIFTEAARGDLAAVKERVSRDRSIAERPDGWHRAPLAYAAAGGQVEVVKFLLSAGAHDPPENDYDYARLNANSWAIFHKRLAVVHLLCEGGSDVNLLDEAIYAESVDIARELLAHKADPRLEDIRGYQPIHEAVVYGQVDIIEALISAGADPNARNGPDRSPCGDPGRTPESFTPLHLAAQQGSLAAIRMLIQRGAMVNALTEEAKTPLHRAAGSYKAPAKMLEAVRELLKAGADINAKDAGGLTALDDAIKASHGEDKKDDLSVVNFLRSEGGKEGKDVPGPNGVSPVNAQTHQLRFGERP